MRGISPVKDEIFQNLGFNYHRIEKVGSWLDKFPHFQTVEELIEYVEREAKKRVEMLTEKYRLLAEREAYDKIILKVLRDKRGR